MSGTLIITGGAGGIGAVTARLGAARGFAVVVNHLAIEKSTADVIVADIRRAGGMAIGIEADITDESAVEQLFSKAAEAAGPIVGLVNSAGIDGNKKAVTDLSAPELRRVFAVNTIGTMLCCRNAVRCMSTRRGGQGGSIVNLSSMAATIGGRSGSVAYAASKAAVDAFTVGLAKEVAQDGVRVNSVRPGMTMTRMTDQLSDSPAKLADIAATIPIGRMATAEEIALPILWLLSSEASFVSGCRLDVSGGGFVVGMNRIAPSE